jgi:hypothetical protein
MTPRHELAADVPNLADIQSAPQRFKPDSQENAFHLFLTRNQVFWKNLVSLGHVPSRSLGQSGFTGPWAEC